MVLPALREKNLAKIQVENDKKIFVLPCQVGEREKSLKKTFEKVFESVKELFLKNLKHDIRLIEKQVRSIEVGRGSQNFLNKISIDQKSDWINRNSRKNSFLEKKPEFLKAYLKALNIRYKNA